MIYSAEPPKQSLVEIDAKPQEPSQKILEDAVRRAHRGLDVHGLDVLPPLLELRGEEVEGRHDILSYFGRRHFDVADGPVESDSLLELDLDGGLALKNLQLQVLIGSKGQRGAACLREPWAGVNRDLTDKRLRRKEDVVGLSELLDLLGVLVELLEMLYLYVVQAKLLGTIGIASIGNDAELQVLLGYVGKDEGKVEAWILLRVVALESDLQLHRFQKLARLLVGGALDDLRDVLVEGFGVNSLHREPHS